MIASNLRQIVFEVQSCVTDVDVVVDADDAIK